MNNHDSAIRIECRSRHLVNLKECNLVLSVQLQLGKSPTGCFCLTCAQKTMQEDPTLRVVVFELCCAEEKQMKDSWIYGCKLKEHRNVVWTWRRNIHLHTEWTNVGTTAM